MFARKGVFSSSGRAAVVATVVAVAITAFEPSMANAGSSPAGKGLSESKGAVTDVSARRRHYHGGGGAAAAAAFAGILGTGLAIAALPRRKRRCALRTWPWEHCSAAPPLPVIPDPNRNHPQVVLEPLVLPHHFQAAAMAFSHRNRAPERFLCFNLHPGTSFSN